MSNMCASFVGNEFRMACQNTAVCHSRTSLKGTTKNWGILYVSGATAPQGLKGPYLRHWLLPLRDTLKSRQLNTHSTSFKSSGRTIWYYKHLCPSVHPSVHPSSLNSELLSSLSPCTKSLLQSLERTLRDSDCEKASYNNNNNNNNNNLLHRGTLSC